MKKTTFLFCPVLCLACLLADAQDENLNVLTGWHQHDIRWINHTQAPYSALNRLNSRAHDLLDRRDREVTRLKTAEEWRQRQDHVRASINAILGPWPEKSPLNVRVLDVLERDKFHVELLAFESLPGLYVTAALYVPAGLKAAAPGILYIPGHANNGFRAAHYQKFCLNLVHKGFVVLAYDPIGQGERQQNIDSETGKTFVSPADLPSYKMHSYPGNQCYLSGRSIAHYFIWDAIRGIDVLVSRSEVDGNRIGVTGTSGGGNITVFVSAIDDRVTVSVPSCWVTSYRRLIEINGLQDAEQNVFGGLVQGLEHADWLLARAPKPTLLMTTTRDFFPIQGARETELEARRAWAAFGASEDFARVEDDHGHGYTRKNSEAAYGFLIRQLGLKTNPAEKDYPLFPDEGLQVTETGQVATALKSETIYSLNRKVTLSLQNKMAPLRQRSGHLPDTVAAARRLSGYEIPQDPTNAVYRGGYQRDGYRVDKYGLIGPDGSVVPLLLFTPDEPGPYPALVYAHPLGKSVHAQPGGFLESITLRGMVAAAVDVTNTGETELPIGRQNDHDILFYTGLMTGGSVVGLQAADLVRATKWMATKNEVIPEQIGLMAVDRIGSSAIHAAAFEPEEVRWLVLEDSPLSYASMVLNRRYDFKSDCMVAGALTAYDLPDLLASIAPRKTLLVSPVDQEKRPLDSESVQSVLQFAMKTYAANQATSKLRIVYDKHVSPSELIEWCAR